MRGKLEKEGQYEIFETTKGSRILTLNHKNWYAIVKGQKGDILVGTDSDHEKKDTIQQGRFYLADFDDDPEFRDVPHLFLKDGGAYTEFILPNDVPDKKGDKQKLIISKDKIDEKKVLDHVKGEGATGNEKQYKNQPEGLSGKSKNELYEMAKKEGISGRSKMSKKELVKELQK